MCVEGLGQEPGEVDKGGGDVLRRPGVSESLGITGLGTLAESERHGQQDCFGEGCNVTAE